MNTNATLEDWLDKEETDRRKEILTKINDVCTVPASAQRVLALVQRENVSTRELANAVSGDAAIANKLLRIANSPFYGQTRKVNGMERAVILVGRKEIRSITAAIAMLMAVQSEKSLATQILGSSLLSGTIAQLISKELGNIDPSSAFLCGLLCEIGALACISVDAEGYTKLWDKAEGSAEQRSELERARYDITSEEIGRQMLVRNRLPEEVIEAVGIASNMHPNDMTLLARVTVFSRLVAPMLISAANEGNNEVLSRDMPELADRLQLSDITDPKLAKICIEAGTTSELKLRGYN